MAGYALELYGCICTESVAGYALGIELNMHQEYGWIYTRNIAEYLLEIFLDVHQDMTEYTPGMWINTN